MSQIRLKFEKANDGAWTDDDYIETARIILSHIRFGSIEPSLAKDVKVVGMIGVPVAMLDVPQLEKIKTAIKDQLGTEYDETKHVIVSVPNQRIGAGLYVVFEI